MKKLSNRIKYQAEQDQLNIHIAPQKDDKADKQLMLWLVLFTLLGLIMIVGSFFFVSTREEVAMVVIYLAFWLFFEIKVLSAFLYRNYGEEHIRIQDGTFFYALTKRGRGVTKSFPLENITNIKFEPKSSSGFLGMINQAKWMIAGEGIEVETTGKSLALGVQLKKGEAEHLIAFLNKEMGKRAKAIK